jgi:LDH2 family malate/lactate/ureidoglycolate dehydrogenase
LVNDETRVLTIGALTDVVETLLSPAGADGKLVASALVDAEILGQHKFGLQLLGQVAGGARLERGMVVATTPGTAVVEASGCFGPVVVAGAARLAVEIAATIGVSLVAIRGLRGVGRLEAYVRLVAEAGFFGLVTTHSPPLVAPLGGRTPVLGNNPIAYAAPSPSGPVVADFATSAITKAQLDEARASGTLLPVDSAIDVEGLPTTDPASVRALLPFDGITGFLVGLFVELLAGAMLGERGNPTGRPNQAPARRNGVTRRNVVVCAFPRRGWEPRPGLRSEVV